MSVFFLRVEDARDRMAAAWQAACEILQHGKAVRIELEQCEPTRSLEQNSKMWACLGDIAKQVEWPVDGKMQYLEPEEWKDIMTAGLKKTQRIAAGIEGGFVMLGIKTRRMKIAEMVELIEFILWFGTEKNVRWSNQAKQTIGERLQ